MPRRGLVTANRVLALSIAAVVVTTFLPARLLGWTRIPGRITQRLTSPPSDLVKVMGDWLVKAEPAEHPEPLIGQIDQLRALVHRLELDNARLRIQVEELSGVRSTQNEPMRLLTTSVIAGTTDPTGRLLRLRAGRRDGIEAGSVASLRGQHLLGRIVNIDDAMCEVLPITDRNAETITVQVYEQDGSKTELFFDLTPVGDGTLKGPGRYVTEGLEQTPRTAKIGQIVRLSDENWIGHGGLIVGEITAVEPSPQSPLRPVITVKPVVDTRRVSSVVVRVPGSAS